MAHYSQVMTHASPSSIVVGPLNDIISEVLSAWNIYENLQQHTIFLAYAPVMVLVEVLAI
jgi:hypothetical protein